MLQEELTLIQVYLHNNKSSVINTLTLHKKTSSLRLLYTMSAYIKHLLHMFIEGVVYYM